jgi:hypothetical protein
MAMKKSVNKDDLDRPPAKRKVSIDVDDILYWHFHIDSDREYDPEKIRSFAKENTPALLRAARQFDLDLADPMERAVLLRVLADLLLVQGAKEAGPCTAKNGRVLSYGN